MVNDTVKSHKATDITIAGKTRHLTLYWRVLDEMEWINSRISKTHSHRKRLALGIVGVLILLYIAVFSALSVARHEAFETSAFDLSLYDQAVWNTLHGRPFRSTNEEGLDILLADHFEPILLPLSLLYLIYSSPKTLLIAQTVVIALGALPAFWLAKEQLGYGLAAIVFPVAYLLSPALEAANLFDFHPLALTASLLLYAFYFLHHRRYGIFFVFALLAMGCKEEIGIVVLMMGLYMLLVHKEWKIGFLTSAVGAIWYYIAVFVVIYHFTTNYPSPNIYSHLGDNAGEVIISIVSRPRFILEILLTKRKLLYLLGVLAPFGPLSLCAPQVLLLALPSLAINLLSSADYMHRLDAFQYAAPIVPFITAAGILGTGYAVRLLNRGLKIGVRQSAYLCCALVLALSLGYHRYHGLSPLAAGFHRPSISAHHRLAREFIEMIPRDAVVSAQTNLNPHLSQRETIYLWPRVEEAEYILLDVASLINKDDIHSWIRKDLLADSEFGVVASQDGYILLRRGWPNAGLTDDFVSFARVENPSPQYPMIFNFGDSLQFLGYDVVHDRVKLTQFRFNLYWRALRKMDKDYFIALYLMDSEGNVVGSSRYPQPTCVWYPTSQWEPGETVRVVGNTFDWWTDEMDRFGVALGVVDGSNEWEVGARLRPRLVEADLVTRMPDDGTLLQFATFHNKLGLAASAPEKRIFAPPAMQHGVHADLNHQVRLLGYDLSPRRTQAGSTVHLTLYWQTLARMDESYTVFTHLLDGENHVWGQKDNIPCDGTCPTTGWVEGEVIVDGYNIGVRPDAPPGEYVIEVGMYEAETGQRLPVLDEGGKIQDDRVLLEKIGIGISK
jgi:uncharacterized membrane protein